MRAQTEARLRKLETAISEPEGDLRPWLELASAELRVMAINPEAVSAQRLAQLCELLPPIVDRIGEAPEVIAETARDMLQTLRSELAPGAHQSDFTARYCFALRRVQAAKPDPGTELLADLMSAAGERLRALEAEPGGLDRDAHERIERVRAAVKTASRSIVVRDTSGRVLGGFETGIPRSPNEPLLSDDGEPIGKGFR